MGNCCLWHPFSPVLEPRLGGDIILFSGRVNLAPCNFSSNNVLLAVQAWGTPRHGAMCQGPPSGGFHPVGGFYPSLASIFPAHYCPLHCLVSFLHPITSLLKWTSLLKCFLIPLIFPKIHGLAMVHASQIFPLPLTPVLAAKKKLRKLNQKETQEFNFNLLLFQYYISLAKTFVKIAIKCNDMKYLRSSNLPYLKTTSLDSKWKFSLVLHLLF